MARYIHVYILSRTITITSVIACGNPVICGFHLASSLSKIRYEVFDALNKLVNKKVVVPVNGSAEAGPNRPKLDTQACSMA
jgi:hypothetical protein